MGDGENESGSKELCKYFIRQAENISPRPLQSLGVYESLDANLLVAGSADKNLRFLEVDSFEEITKYEVNKKSVNCVTISGISINGDDPFIITAGKDKAMQIWSPASGNLGKDVELPTTEVLALATYQGSSSFVLIGTKDCKVLLWDIFKNQMIASFVGHRAGVYTVAIASTIPFSEIQNGNDLSNLIIASGSVDHTARTWDFQTTKKVQKFRHKRSVYSLVITQKTPQPLLVTGGAEYLVRLWDIKTGILLRTFEGHLGRINSLCLWEGYQSLIISASGDRTIRIFDLLTGECISILQGHSGDVLTVLWTHADSNSYTFKETFQDSSNDISLSPTTSPVLVSSSEDLSLIQWDLFRIIGDHYHTTGENNGLRNSTTPYHPAIRYIPPIEVDIGNLKGLSKEERRKLKKDMKKQKIQRMSQKYRRARSNVSQDSRCSNFDEDEDDEMFVFDGAVSDDDDDGEGDTQGKQKTEKKRSKSRGKKEQITLETSELKEDEEDETFFMKILKGEDEDEPVTREEIKQRHHQMPVTLSGEQKDKQDEIIAAVSTPIMENSFAGNTSQPSSRKSSINRILPSNLDSTVKTVDHNALKEIGSLLRRASAGMVNSMISMIQGPNMVPGKSRHNSKVGIEPPPGQSLRKNSDSQSRSGSLSGPSQVSLPNNGQINTGSRSNSISPAPTPSQPLPVSVEIVEKLPTDYPQLSTHHSLRPSTNESRESITPHSTANISRGTTPNDHPQTSRDSSIHVENEIDFRHRAHNTLTDYHLAQVENELEADKRRQEASAKLASRLKRRKTGNDPTTSQSESNQTEKTEDEMVTIKEKKLMQHKLQTTRARQSMLIAKGRAAEALQKRLDELNQKKQKEAGDGDGSSDDDKK